MDIWLQIFCTSALTIIGSIVVFVAGEIIINIIIKPVIELRNTIGEVSDNLIYYADIYMNPGVTKVELMDEAKKNIRQISSKLRAEAYTISLYDECLELGLIPTKKSIDEAAKALIGLSNSIHNGNAMQNGRWADEVRNALKLPKEE